MRRYHELEERQVKVRTGGQEGIDWNAADKAELIKLALDTAVFKKFQEDHMTSSGTSGRMEAARRFVSQAREAAWGWARREAEGEG